MSTRRKPPVAEILTGDDGPCILVRGKTTAELLEIAHGEAAGDDYVVTDPESVNVGWIRAVPCVGKESGGHEFDGAGGYCDGGMRCHYIPSREGPGAFSGAFIEITYSDDLEDDDPRKARYLAECAEMEARSVARAEAAVAAQQEADHA
jgi:hypothetical protein